MKKFYSYLLSFTLIAIPILARAGGAGGRSSSSSFRISGSGGGGSVFGMIFLLGFGGIAVFAFISSSIQKGKFNEKKEIDKEKFLERNPNFDFEKFRAKVKDDFFDVQNAWMNKDLTSVKGLISDGVYQKFHSQILMMTELKQKNRLEELQVKDIEDFYYEIDGEFDIIYVKIKAKAKDIFECELNKKLERYSDESFTEYWAYIRKKSDKEYDINDNRCPSCGAHSEDYNIKQVSQCSYCGAIVNSGQFDWVLSEIYQRPYPIMRRALKQSTKETTAIIKKLREIDSNFSKQLLEDKMGNALVQIDKAEALVKPELARRFVTDSLYKKISLKKDKFYYNTYYFEYAEVTSLGEDKEYFYANILVVRKSQRVKIGLKGIKIIDDNVRSKDIKLVAMKSKEKVEVKGSLYANSCPSCGANLEDSVDTNCRYCGKLINDPKYDWIVKSIN